MESSSIMEASGVKNEEASAAVSVKQSRTQLTLAEKKQILDKIAAGESISRVGRAYGIPRTTVMSVIKKRTAIEAALGTGASAKRKRLTLGKWADLDQALVVWLKEVRAAKAQLGGAQLKEKALSLAAELGYTDFTCTEGWLFRFKERYDVKFRSTPHEGKIEEDFSENSTNGVPPSTTSTTEITPTLAGGGDNESAWLNDLLSQSISASTSAEAMLPGDIDLITNDEFLGCSELLRYAHSSDSRLNELFAGSAGGPSTTSVMTTTQFGGGSAPTCTATIVERMDGGHSSQQLSAITGKCSRGGGATNGLHQQEKPKQSISNAVATAKETHYGEGVGMMGASRPRFPTTSQPQQGLEGHLSRRPAEKISAETTPNNHQQRSETELRLRLLEKRLENEENLGKILHKASNLADLGRELLQRMLKNSSSPANAQQLEPNTHHSAHPGHIQYQHAK